MQTELKALRRINLRKLAQKFGGISMLARQLDKTPAQLSHLIGINARKNMGDKLAYSTEQKLGLPSGWLDTPHSEEDASNYEDSRVTVSSVPLLTDYEVLKWLQKPSRSLFQRKVQYVKTSLQLNKHAFALQVHNDLMEAPSGFSLPRGSIVIADPELPVKNNNYIIICLERNLAPLIRQLVQEGSRKYLKPLNPCYPIIELTAPTYIVCGILRQAIITL